MSQETKRFIGRAIVIDPRTGQDSEYSAYVYLLLTGPTEVPSVTVCEAPSFDELMDKIRREDVTRHFPHAKLTFEPPRAQPFVSHSMARQRYEALPYAEFTKAQTIMSGR